MSTIARFSVEEYDRIVATGAFDGKNRRRIELIRGEIREMSPIGSKHADIVAWLNIWSVENVPRDVAGIRVQSPLSLGAVESEPEPDILWVLPKRYRAAHPTSNDVILLIEVADSSLDYDRGEKAETYADAGIREYWLVNIIDRTIEVRRDPKDGEYLSEQVFAAGETLNSLGVPGVQLNVDEVFGSAP
jgi:Uma2 family endonuclease